MQNLPPELIRVPGQGNREGSGTHPPHPTRSFNPLGATQHRLMRARERLGWFETESRVGVGLSQR